MRTLNLGISAHVDAGKTSLTERLLYAAGVIDAVGNVDDGNTQTDTLWLEQQRGITIKSTVVSFMNNDVTVNLIDTPGHPDFIAEVERALSVLDGAVLVISAVEGVQSQTRVLMRTLQRLSIPTLIFVNKIDRAGAGEGRVVQDIATTLMPAIIPMGAAHGILTFAARALGLRAIEGHIDGAAAARRVYAGACFLGALGLIVPAYAPGSVAGSAGVLLVRGVAMTMTRAVGVIWVNRRATSEVRATMRSFLAQAEYAGEILCGVSLGILAQGTTITSAFAGACAILACTGLMVRFVRTSVIRQEEGAHAGS